jgi:hypothetical protein
VLLFLVSFSKLVILVYTGQPVKNNTAYACYIYNYIILILIFFFTRPGRLL